MQTSDLIEALAAELRPVPARAAASRLVVGVLAGAIVALVAVWLTLGPREDFPDATQTLAFWIKWSYGVAMTAVAAWLSLRLARPERTSGASLLALAAPLILLAVLAFFELGSASPGERMQLWLGQSAARCPWIIAALALPLFVGILWAFRKFAPTRPRLAGFCSGGLAGAVAAVVYAVHCTESAAAFVATWYTLGMLLPALVGLLIGPRVLRW